MDLKIAAITLAHDALLLHPELGGFRKVSGSAWTDGHSGLRTFREKIEYADQLYDHDAQDICTTPWSSAAGRRSFFLSASSAALDLPDPALQHPGVPQSRLETLPYLTPRYAPGLKHGSPRVDSKACPQQHLGTEWPLFGQYFISGASRTFISAWESGDHTARVSDPSICPGTPSSPPRTGH